MPPWNRVSGIDESSTSDAVRVDLLSSIMLQVGKSQRGVLGVGIYAENFTDLSKIKVLEGVYDADQDRVAIP